VSVVAGVLSAAKMARVSQAAFETPIPDYLAEVVGWCSSDAGAVADYIPELGKVDPEQLGVCVSTVDGVAYLAGARAAEFTIQSISKPFVYALALAEHGVDAVLEHVGVEPSGESFDELSLDAVSGRPRNAMINAGALTAHALVGPAGAGVPERVERIRAGLSAFAGRQLSVDHAVRDSELQHAHRNLAIARMLHGHGVVRLDPEDVVAGYTAQCAVRVTLADLGTMAAVLANGGVRPGTDERLLPVEVVRQTLSVMLTCGMYDGAGEWMTEVGFPAKSGVSGAILGVLPGQVGIATFSPRLDRHGNSTRGVQICRRLSADMGMHIMAAPEPARSVIRRDRVLRGARGSVRICSLQGSIQFSGAERVLRELSAGPRHHRVVLDLRRAYSINEVAQRMLGEALRRLHRHGTRVSLLDPERLLRGAPDIVERVRGLSAYRDLDRV